MLRDRTELAVDRGYDLLVPDRVQETPRRGHVDEPANNTRLGVRDLHRLVRAHEQERPGLRRICRLELLVDDHVLVRDETVQLGVVLDATEVPIMLDRHERVLAEALEGELVVRPRQSLRVERRGISLEQLLNDIEDGRLTRASLAIEDEELLDRPTVAVDNGADGPLDLGALLGVVQR